MEKNTQAISPKWYWYGIAFISAILCGINCFIISWDFMFSKTPVALAFVCAFSGLLLNTALYWREGAHKLSHFSKGIQNQPLRILQHTYVEVCSALCIGCLTYQSYTNQLAIWAITGPITTRIITWVMSSANAIANFALFSEVPENESTPSRSQITTPSFATILTQLLMPFKFNSKTVLASSTSVFLAYTQSIAYAYLNFLSVNSLMLTLLPSAYATGLSIGLAATLLRAEINFNQKETYTFLTKQRESIPAWWYFTLIIGNGFANGWIALGDLTFLPFSIQTTIISVGSFVSFCVMYNNAFQSSQVKAAFLPETRKEQQQFIQFITLVASSICLACIAWNPWILHQSLASQCFLYTNLIVFTTSLNSFWPQSHTHLKTRLADTHHLAEKSTNMTTKNKSRLTPENHNHSKKPTSANTSINDPKGASNAP